MVVRRTRSVRSWLRGINFGDYRRRRVPFIASPAPPCASAMGGRERANLTRPRRARLIAASTLGITVGVGFLSLLHLLRLAPHLWESGNVRTSPVPAVLV